MAEEEEIKEQKYWRRENNVTIGNGTQDMIRGRKGKIGREENARGMTKKKKEEEGRKT